MSDARQLPLFSWDPASSDDINRQTALSDSFTLFQKHLLGDGKSEYTVKAFTADLNLLADFVGETKPLGKITTTVLNDFMEWLEHGRGVPCSRKSYARRVTTLKVFFRWVVSTGALRIDPARPVLQRSGPAPLSIILSPADVDAASAYADSLRHTDKPDARPALLFNLLAATGMKKNEVARLALEHIDRSHAASPILFVKHKSAKNVYKERRIPVPPEWLTLLDEYVAQYHTEDVIFDCTPRNLEYVLEDVGQGGGLPMKISFEMMRWTSAVRDFRAGVDGDSIRDRLGLSDASWQETFSKIKKLAAQQIAAESGLLETDAD